MVYTKIMSEPETSTMEGRDALSAPSKGQLEPGPPTQEIFAQFARLAYNLPDPQGGVHSLALVSTKPSEGVSTCSASLARYLARNLNIPVLLVDANIRDPTVHELAGMDIGPGLAGVLRGEIPVERAIRKTAVDNLSVLTAGESGDLEPPVLFQSCDLKENLIGELRKLSFGFAIFDCPPVSVSSEATLIGSACDSVILVVEGGRLRWQAIQNSVATLQGSDCNLMGVILNKRKYYIPQSIYDRI